MLDHLISLVSRGCIPGFVNLVRSADINAARLGLQFLELVMRGMPDGQGPKLVQQEDDIDAVERFQFHENEDLRILGTSVKITVLRSRNSLVWISDAGFLSIYLHAVPLLHQSSGHKCMRYLLPFLRSFY